MLLFLFFAATQSDASHFAGGDLTYRCIGQDSFKITTKIYRDCSGLSFNVPSINFQIWAVHPILNTIRSVNLQLYNRQTNILSFDCSSLISTCWPNPNIAYGLQEIIFDTIFHLPTLFGNNWNSAFCKIFFMTQLGGIRNSPTNIVGGSMTLYSYLNRCDAPSNNSPQLLNRPTLLVCNGVLTSFNLGAIDTFDYDSFSYQMIPPQSDFNNSISYISGFSVKKPFVYLGMIGRDLLIDSINGDLKFISTQIQQPTLAIKISEWRFVNNNWVEVGYVIRDMQFYSVQCAPNNPPVVEFFPNNQLQQICQGQSTCFTVRARDPDSAYGHADTTVISWNYSLKGATFTSLNTPVKTVKNDVATICWTADSSRVKPSPYWMVLRVTDGYCPISSSNAYAVGVVVNPNFAINIQREQQPCQTYRLIARPSRYLYSAKYVWRAHHTAGNNYIDTLAVQIGTDSVLTYRFTKPGKYIVRLGVTTNGTCEKFAYDTLLVDTPFAAHLTSNRQQVCLGDSLELYGSLTHFKGSVTRWYYTNYDSIQQGTVFKFLPLFTQAIRLVARDSAGCETHDTLSINVDSVPVVNLPSEYMACPGDTILIDAGDNSGLGGITYQWYTNNMQADTQRVIKALTQGLYAVRVMYSNGCERSDTTVLNFVNLTQNNIKGDTLVCRGEPVRLYTDGITFEWFNLSDSSMYTHAVTDSAVVFIPDTSTRVALRAVKKYATNTCVVSDTVLVTVKSLPVVSVSTVSEKVCCGFHAPVNIQPKGGMLTLNAVNITDSFLVSCIQPQVLLYRYSDSSGCLNADTFAVNTESPLSGKIQVSSDTVCVKDSIRVSVNITSGSPSAYNWAVNGTGMYNLINPGDLSYTFTEDDEWKKQVVFTVTVKPYGVCPDVKMQSVVQVSPTPSVTAALFQPDSVCAPALVHLQLGAHEAQYYRWFRDVQNVSDSIETTVSDVQMIYNIRGMYYPKVKLVSSYGCKAEYTYPVPVRVFDSPAVYAKAKTPSALSNGIEWNNQVVQFSDSVSGIHAGEEFSILWMLDNVLIHTFQTSPNVFQHYFNKTDISLPEQWIPHVRLITEKGCITETTLPALQFVPPLQVFIPNAIRTYSLQEENQTFGIIAHNYSEARLHIYNRWGQMIFETNQIKERWNPTNAGVKVPEGNYFYILEIKDLNGKEYRYSGSVAVMH